MKKIIKNKYTFLLVILYILMIVITLCSTISRFYSDKNLIKANELQKTTYNISDFQQLSMQEYQSAENNLKQQYISTTTDPQLILNENLYINSISFSLKTSVLPNEVIIYYTLAENENFSMKNKLYPTKVDTKTGEYTFVFDTKNIYSLRIDPVATENCVFQIGDIKVNYDKKTNDYFRLTTLNLVIIATLPIIIFSFIKLFTAIVTQFLYFLKNK